MGTLSSSMLPPEIIGTPSVTDSSSSSAASMEKFCIRIPSPEPISSCILVTDCGCVALTDGITPAEAEYCASCAVSASISSGVALGIFAASNPPEPPSAE